MSLIQPFAMELWVTFITTACICLAFVVVYAASYPKVRNAR
jgi:hypothetical protein